MAVSEKILVIGSSGQIGTELTAQLQNIYGEANVVASDIKKPQNFSGRFEELDVLDEKFTGLFTDLKTVMMAEFKKINYRPEIDNLEKRVLKLEQIVF